MPTLVEPSSMDKRTFDAFRALIYAQSGITLGPQKESLVRSRIAKRIRALGLEDHAAYLTYVEAEASGEELVQMLDVISTNVTSFFREGVHFEVLAQHLQQCQERTIRLWSAACSSGEEPYSMALTILGKCELSGREVRILATDLSTRMLDRCRSGQFAPDRLRGLPPGYQRFFTRQPDGVQQVCEAARRLVTVRRLNLSQPPFPMRGPFQAVFCRNVMIYFDQTVRKALLAEIVRLLAPGGLLFVGHAESLAGMLTRLRSVRPSVYIKD